MAAVVCRAFLGRLLSDCGRRGLAAENTFQPGFEAVPPRGFFLRGDSRRRLGMAHAFDGRLRTGRFGFFAAERFGGFVFFRLGNAFVARFAVFFYVINADAVDFVVRISK